MNQFKENILAGAEQQEDDTQEYREVPMITINDYSGRPYLSVVDDDKIVKIRLHNYDAQYSRGIYLNIDKRALPELIRALEEYEPW